MKLTLSIAAAALSIAGGTAAFAAELPTYELAGFPISPVQLQALGPAGAQERAPTLTATASPHQARVLTARPGLTTGTAAPIRAGTDLAAR